MGKLVYINYNQKLQARYRQKMLQTPTFDAIAVEDLNWSSEWMTGVEGAANEFVYTEEEGLTWADVHEAVGETDHAGPSTRSYQRRMPSQDFGEHLEEFYDDPLDE